MTETADNPLLRLHKLGQSVWLDDIRRRWLRDGTLARLILDNALRGVTSNPAIFEKAISAGDEYEPALATLAHLGLDSAAICEALALEDVAAAADQLRTTHEDSSGQDGFVSIEVSPRLAHDTEGTVAEAKRLWTLLARPNVMIKVPGTRAGLPAIQQLLAAGVNVNVTLLFSVSRYREVANAFLAALEVRVATGLPLENCASVASFFLSRIDTLVDHQLDTLDNDAARALRGCAAIASAQLAYQAFKEICASPHWQRLAQHGARPQRLLWASTSTKDKRYEDTKYVEPLIAPQTINTLPRETLDAYRDHGQPALRIEHDIEAASQLPARLATLGIRLETVCEQLEREGVQKFIEPYDRLQATIQQRIAAARKV